MILLYCRNTLKTLSCFWGPLLRRDADPDVRVDKALERLWRFLSFPPEEYECYIEVAGLDVNFLPANFGHVRFVIFNMYQLRKLKRIIRINHTEDILNKLEAINTVLRPLLNHPVAIVKVKAKDNQAAKVLAERKVRTTIECLNFFLSLIPGNNREIFLPTERRSNSIGGFSVATGSGDVSTFNVFIDTSYEHGKGVSISAIYQSENPVVCQAVKRVKLLLKESKNEVEELTLRAVYWAGRATVEQIREESFLLFTVALECLILPGSETDELRYRLSLRVARLLGNDARERKKIMKKTKKLYDIRSKIVHSGYYAVAEEEYAEIYDITRRIILDLLINRYIRRFDKLEKFEQWFNELSVK